ncbi:HAD-IC family P-type ATPase, partial [Patescibacteria group bacterium]|nr:HAD-IC family P-type ATPase [Patescibacteria group bacterium]
MQTPSTNFSTKTVAETFSALQSSSNGLAVDEAARRLREQGSNIVVAREVTAFTILGRQFRSPLVLLLLGAVCVSILLGEIIDGVTILGILSINIGLSFFQEYRSAHTLERLRSYVAATPTVRRGGMVQQVPAATLVTGDMVLLAPGDIVQADLRVTNSHGLLVDESVLTGESAPQAKSTEPLARVAVGQSDMLAMIFSGTTVVSGAGEAVVVATGSATAFGAVAKRVAETEKVGAFEESVGKFSLFLAQFVGLALALVFVGNLLIEGKQAHVGELLLFSLALAISVVPEALPAVIAMTFARGASHLAKKKVVMKRLSAIEDLGHIEVLCTDKTGTITENKMRVAEVFGCDAASVTSVALQSLAMETGGAQTLSSFDLAIQAFGKGQKIESITVLSRIPFDPLRRRETLVVKTENDTRLISKGAPEDVLRLCTTEQGKPLSDARRAEILSAFHDFGKRGMRVLALAKKSLAWQGSLAIDDEAALSFVGLVAFEDPLKESAKNAIQLAEKLHVRVKILTGDSAEVAGAVAVAVGIVKTADAVFIGEQLAAMTPDMFARTVDENDVFARVTPEQKYLIIQALEKRYAVGFLGEGINDAPALSVAQVGLVVQGASDVAKDAADALLLDRSLNVIVDGIREGRVIFANVAKYIRYTLSGNLGNMVSIAGLSVVLPYLPMLPAQLLLVNLLTDLPLISIVTDRVDPEDVRAPHRFNIRELASFALLMGLVSTLFDFTFFGIFRHASPAVIQSSWFIESVLQELAVIFAMRTRLPFFRAIAPSRMLTVLAIGAMV